MVPCTRLYAHIGCQLRAAALAAPGEIRAQGPYASWIKEYSSDAFLAVPAAKEALLDKLAHKEPYGEPSLTVYQVQALCTSEAMASRGKQNGMLSCLWMTSPFGGQQFSR